MHPVQLFIGAVVLAIAISEFVGLFIGLWPEPETESEK